VKAGTLPGGGPSGEAAGDAGPDLRVTTSLECYNSSALSLRRSVKAGTLPEVDPQEKPRGWFTPLHNFLTLRNGTVIVLHAQDESRHAA